METWLSSEDGTARESRSLAPEVADAYDLLGKICCTRAMADGVTVALIVTVLGVLSVVATSVSVSMWAFRPIKFQTGAWLHRLLGVVSVVWTVFLAAAGAALLILGGWQADVLGAVALACLPVSLLAMRKRRLTFRTQ
jgi:hypothetical protein